ncbi:MAG: polysaccharide pyruvyl transferase family protein [Cyanobacteria bacterium P01_D01_bin.156]
MIWHKGILVCGFYGYHNLGDEAMLHGLCHWLKRCGLNHDLTVYSKDPDDTQQRHGLRALDNRYAPRRRARLKQWISQTTTILQHRYFILGGGDLLRDAADRDVAGEWLRPLEKAIASGKRTLVLGISVGNLWRPATKARIKAALNQVDVIAVRDPDSYQRLTALGISKTVYIISDLALEAVSPLQTFPNNSRPNIGISVRAIAGRNNMSNASFYNHLAQTIDQLVETHNAKVHLIPFQAYPENFRQRYKPTIDDEVAITEVLNLSRYSEKLIPVGRLGSLDELINHLSTLDMMIGTRLHAVILSAGLGVPVIAIEYAPKVTGFMHAINQQAWSIPMENFTAHQACSCVDRVLKDIDSVRQQLNDGVQKYKIQMHPIDSVLKQVLLESKP